MNTESRTVSDVLLGAVMIVIGLVPTGFVAFELLTDTTLSTPFLIDSMWALEALFRVVGSVCGLVLAAMGVLTMKHGTDEGDRRNETRLM